MHGSAWNCATEGDAYSLSLCEKCIFMCYTYIVPIMELPIGVKVKTISLLSSWTVLGCVSIYSPYTEDATADEYQK